LPDEPVPGADATAAAAERVAGSPDLGRALQALTDAYGRAAGASVASLAAGGWSGAPIGETWIYEAGPASADSLMLEELVGGLREVSGSPLEPDRDFEWRSRHHRGSSFDFIGLRVRVGGLPRAALCAALPEPADPPDDLVDLTRHFGSLASLCLLGEGSDEVASGRAARPLATCLDPGEITAALASEVSRCGVSHESLSLCFINFGTAGVNEAKVLERLMGLIGHTVAEAGHPYDFVGRVADAELLVVMPGANHDDGVATARHLMRVARLSLSAVLDDRVQPVFRIAEWDRGERADELLRRGQTEVRDRS